MFLINSITVTVFPTPAPPNNPTFPPFANGQRRSITLIPVSNTSASVDCSSNVGAKKFVELGQNVKIGQVLLIIEAMKTMNEITADKNGIVKKIFVSNEAPVEFGEPLILIE